MSDPPEITVEEMSFGPEPIAGVPTDIPAILGEAAEGPAEPTPVISLADYRRQFGDAPGPLADAVEGFFGNGGRRAIVVRIIAGDYTSALVTLERGAAAREVSLVYAPDATATPGLPEALIDHCERLGDRFAVIDAPRDGDPLPPRAWETTCAAYYHPWLVVPDPATGGTRQVPPGGHVLGVYAHVDSAHGVWKAPANVVIAGVVDVARRIGEAEQSELAPRGVNVIRRFEDRVVVVWGARTLSPDHLDWKYVNVRRLFIYLEQSIANGTEWVVFEPNGEELWARVRDTIRNFLRSQWRMGAFQGRTEEDAFFVQCGRETMTQDDIDNGRLVCIVGVAPVHPAEFVIFRIGQWTVEHSGGNDTQAAV